MKPYCLILQERFCSDVLYKIQQKTTTPKKKKQKERKEEKINFNIKININLYMLQQ